MLNAIIDPNISGSQMTRPATDWIERAAHALYEAERAEHPDRDLPSWDRASHTMRVDARYRAVAAHMRGDVTVKAALVEILASSLANLAGFAWPACGHDKPEGMPVEQYACVQAERRQMFRHHARAVIAAQNKYLDVDAAGEPDSQRVTRVRLAALQHAADVTAVKKWKHIREFGFDMPFVEGVQ